MELEVAAKFVEPVLRLATATGHVDYIFDVADDTSGVERVDCRCDGLACRVRGPGSYATCGLGVNTLLFTCPLLPVYLGWCKSPSCVTT